MLPFLLIDHPEFERRQRLYSAQKYRSVYKVVSFYKRFAATTVSNFQLCAENALFGLNYSINEVIVKQAS